MWWKRRKPGQIYRINLFNGYHTYGLELNNGQVAVLDILTTEQLTVHAVVDLPRLFTVGVLDQDVAKWKQIGYAEITGEQGRGPDVFVQDIIDLSIRILDDNGDSRSATYNEVLYMERARGWYAFMVEQRARDHFASKTNTQYVLDRPKPLDAPHVPHKTPYVPMPGSIRRIDLGDDTHVFARELPNTFFAIYDSRTDDITLPKHLTRYPILFTVSVRLSAQVGWPRVALVPLNASEHPLPKRYLRIGSKPGDFLIFSNPLDPDFKGHKGHVSEAIGLEPAVMWDNYHVENRIRAHYAGTSWDFDPG